MNTAIALLLDRCGLSHREAAIFLGVRPDTVSSWRSGRNNAPAGVIAELRDLYARIEQAATEALAVIQKQRPTEVEIGVAVDDTEAQALGWPCVNAHLALAGLIVARCNLPVQIVPRGTTIATAAASDAHGR